MTQKWEGYHTHRGPPWEAKGLNPHQAPQLKGSALGRWVPRTSSFENQQGSHSGKPEGYWEERPLLQGTHKTSHALNPSPEAAVWKVPGQTYLLIMESPLESRRQLGLPGHREAGRNHFKDIILPCWHQSWQGPFWNPPSRQLMTDLSTSGPTAACGTGPDSQPGGAYPTHRQPQVMGHCHQPPRSLPHPPAQPQKQHEGENYSRPGQGPASPIVGNSSQIAQQRVHTVHI